MAAPPQSPLLDVALWTAGAPSVSMALVAPSAMLLPVLRRLEALFLLSRTDWVALGPCCPDFHRDFSGWLAGFHNRDMRPGRHQPFSRAVLDLKGIAAG